MRQIIVPIGFLALLAGLLFPLPSVIVDYLLVINITLAMLLLGSSLYISDPLKISSLPSFLLVATLFRLTLNVSTTRLLLSTGDSGRVVAAFGRVVAQDNLVVGFVVFLIISFIQLVVIAKGSERVAEVSARFTLDAMPGKQMSIDADMRSGLIDFNEARHKRRDLQTESRFYSALDGAIKFIKGDAIAGLIITTVNIVGGILVGVILNGLDIKSALAHYTLMTIGDGLVSQIPALLNSVAAGIIVTRVTDDDKCNLGAQFFNQIFGSNTVKITIACLCFGAATISGVPGLPFLIMGTVLILLSLNSPTVNSVDTAAKIMFRPGSPVLIKVEIPGSYRQAESSKDLLVVFENWRARVYREYGVLLPCPVLEFKVTDRIRVLLREYEVVSLNPLPDEKQLGDCLAEELWKVVSANRLEFVDDIQTRRLLDLMEKESPELVASVVPEVATVTKITGILRELLGEGLAIINFDQILQAIAESHLNNLGLRQILEQVRLRLKRQITAHYAKDGIIRALTIDPDIDLEFYRAEREGQTFNHLLLEEIAEKIQHWRKTEPRIILVVSRGSRKILRECLESKNIDLPVLAYEEISDNVRIQAVEHIKGVRKPALIKSAALPVAAFN